MGSDFMCWRRLVCSDGLRQNLCFCRQGGREIDCGAEGEFASTRIFGEEQPRYRVEVFSEFHATGGGEREAGRESEGGIVRMGSDFMCWRRLVCSDGLRQNICFFDKEREKLIAEQKANLLALANSAKSNQDTEWMFFRNFMRRVVEKGKLPENLREEFFRWEGVLCEDSLPVAAAADVKRIVTFFEHNRERLIAEQKPNLRALANSAVSKKDLEWKFFRNFMERHVEKGKLPDYLREELFAWESVLCEQEGKLLQKFITLIESKQEMWRSGEHSTINPFIDIGMSPK